MSDGSGVFLQVHFVTYNYFEHYNNFDASACIYRTIHDHSETAKSSHVTSNYCIILYLTLFLDIPLLSVPPVLYALPLSVTHRQECPRTFEDEMRGCTQQKLVAARLSMDTVALSPPSLRLARQECERVCHTICSSLTLKLQ